MSRSPNLIPSDKLTIALPSPVHEQLRQFLYSTLEGRVPHGAYSRWISERIREYFSASELDLAEFMEVPPGLFLLRGSPKTVEMLREYLLKLRETK